MWRKHKRGSGVLGNFLFLDLDAGCIIFSIWKFKMCIYEKHFSVCMLLYDKVI